MPEQNSIYKDTTLNPMIPNEMKHNLHCGKELGDGLTPPHDTNIISLEKIMCIMW